MALAGAQPDYFGRLTIANPAFCALVGRPANDVAGMHLSDFIDRTDRAAVVAMLDELAGGGPATDAEVRLCGRDETPIWIRLTLSLIRDAAGRPERFFAQIEDISQRRAAAAALDERTARLRRAVDDAPIGMALTAIDGGGLGRFLDVNPALCRITGRSQADLSRTTFEELLTDDGRRRAAGLMRSLIARELPRCTFHERYRRPDGTPGWMAVHASIAYDDADAPMYCIVQIIDITWVKEAESKLEHVAYHDALTGLLNRPGLVREVQRRFMAPDGPPRSALLLLDLDHFKYVNDAMGHAGGDEVLATIATIVCRVAPPEAVVGRLGGDEFLVLLPDADAEFATTTAGNIRRSIQSSIRVGTESDLRATASVGIVLVDKSTPQAIDEAIVAANAALVNAKAQGRNRSIVAAALERRHSPIREQLTWSQRIARALENDLFTLYAQPILNLRTGIVERYELLIRMIDDNGAIRGPGEFLPVAERSGLMPEIDRWVITHAIDIAAREQRAGRAVVVEINLSGASLTNESIAACIDRELAATGLDPRALVFEITETAAIENMDQACRFAERISALGCAFALDDFGAGFSSFYYLKYLPFSDLKIDGEFIRNLTGNASDQHIVRAIVELARGLGKATIAEFVGNDETAVLLQHYGVDFAQGYYIGEPLPWETARAAARGAQIIV